MFSFTLFDSCILILNKASAKVYKLTFTSAHNFDQSKCAATFLTSLLFNILCAKPKHKHYMLATNHPMNRFEFK